MIENTLSVISKSFMLAVYDISVELYHLTMAFMKCHYYADSDLPSAPRSEEEEDMSSSWRLRASCPA